MVYERIMHGRGDPDTILGNLAFLKDVEPNSYNQRTDGSSARMTSKREMENYIHPSAIRAVYGVNFEIDDQTDVPRVISDYLKAQNLPGSNQKNVKRRLNGEATQYMTLELLKERDQQNEVLSWICDIMQLDINSYV